MLLSHYVTLEIFYWLNIIRFGELIICLTSEYYSSTAIILTFYTVIVGCPFLFHLI
ncbi:protein of unknown function [Xenorhabdus poinarii G6]|uniref:Uncharacterized protein n=1 Tax=Xenorhabdus poinarii G6 TaxID=1354304 RepID=A0A068R9M6_9GAMM|nr:protein of unknown function [Xenorhabdus poinarii G6]